MLKSIIMSSKIEFFIFVVDGFLSGALVESSIAIGNEGYSPVPEGWIDSFDC